MQHLVRHNLIYIALFCFTILITLALPQISYAIPDDGNRGTSESSRDTSSGGSGREGSLNEGSGSGSSAGDSARESSRDTSSGGSGRESSLNEGRGSGSEAGDRARDTATERTVQESNNNSKSSSKSGESAGSSDSRSSGGFFRDLRDAFGSIFKGPSERRKGGGYTSFWDRINGGGPGRSFFSGRSGNQNNFVDTFPTYERGTPDRACPIYNTPRCPDGKEPVESGVDEHGCKLQAVCQTRIASSSCPTYNIPRCSETQAVAYGPQDERGCYLPPTCVDKVIKNSVSCPVYNVPRCTATQNLVIGELGENGCQQPSQCVEKTSQLVSKSVSLEVKVMRQASTTREKILVHDWTTKNVEVAKDDILYFRWNAPGYTSCIHDLNFEKYDFSTNTAGNTEATNTGVLTKTDSYNVACTSAEGETAATINVTIQ